jgi:proline iminopeptidase
MRLERVLAAFEKLGGKQARDVANTFWERPSRDNLAEYMRVCIPLYNPSGTLANEDARARTVWSLEVMEHFITGEQRTMELFPELHRLNCPILILAGDHDPVCTIEDMQELAGAIPGNLVRFERFAEAGHGVFRDSPGRALKSLREFIVQ